MSMLELYLCSYGRKLHLLMRGVDLLLLAMVLVLSFTLKAWPVVEDAHAGLAIAILAVITLVLLRELWVVLLFGRNEQASLRQPHP
jgi:hypothetical protein